MANTEELSVIFQTFSNQMTGLTSQMTNVNNSIGSISSSLIVPPYAGDPKQFQNWIKSIEKQALLDNLSDDGIKRLTFRSSRDAVSDFIQRFLNDYPQENWARLKQELTARFCDVTDQMHAFTLLRNIRQKTSETVQIYAERLLTLGKDSFPPDTDRHTIERQLIGFFVDGLQHDSLKMKLMRANPGTFQAAVTIALQEQNLMRRFSLRTNMGEYRSQRDTPMEIDHMRHSRRSGQRSDDRNRSHRAHIHAVSNAQRPNGPEIICYNCGKGGHIKRECKAKKGNQSGIVCYSCGRQGHIKRDCGANKGYQTENY